MWNDAMRHTVLPRSFCCRVAMEPIHIRASLRRHCVRYICVCHTHCADAATADPSFDAARKNDLACLSHLCARAKLDLSAGALAQLLKSKSHRFPAWPFLEGV